MTPSIPLRQALDDVGLLGHVLRGDSWRTWRILLIAAMGEQLTEDEREIFRRVTGREHEPNKRVSELEVIAGRRGGKTIALAALVTYISALCDHRDTLAPGETGVCLALAQDQRIAVKLLDFCQENLERSPALAQLIVGRSQDTLQLKNNITIESRPASLRKLRGPTFCCIIADELAFWFVDEFYANPDVEVLAAAKPGLLTTHGPLIMASSPYAKRGVLYDTFKRHYGPNGSPAILVAKGTTRDFNPTISQEEIDIELEKDRVRNTSEYLAEWRNDVSSLVSVDAVMSCVDKNVFERAPTPGVMYYGVVDMAGGGGADSAALCIGHIDHIKQIVVVDCIRERPPPFSPEVVTQDFCSVLRTYNIFKIIGDRWAGAYPPEQFGKFNVLYEQSAKPKSDLYQDLLPMINSGRVRLLDHPRLISQLCGLERRSGGRGGRDIIDHFPGSNDDIVNSVACFASINTLYPQYDHEYRGFGGGDPDADREGQAARYQRQRLAGRLFALSGGQIWPR